MTELKTAASGTKDARKTKALRGVAIALLLCLVSMFLQNLIQTDFGRVKIQQIQTVGISGYKHTATLYIPENATPETPAPAVLMAHGSWKAREVMNSYAVELARRGYVVYNYDQYGMGDSEPVNKRSVDSRDALEIVAKLPYVNPEQIGITGHSSGARVGDMLCKQLEAEESDLQFAAILLVDNDPYYKNDDKEWTNNYGSVNYGVVACQYDDWFFSIQDENGEWVVRPRDYIRNDNCKSFLAFGEDPSAFEGTPVAGQYYTKVIDGKEATRVVYTPKEIHSWGSLSPASVKYAIEFFQHTMPAPKPMAPSDAMGFGKECISFVGVIGLVLFMVYFTLAMLELPFFSSLKAAEVAVSRPAPDDLKGKLWFWGGLTAGAVFSYLAFHWFMRPIYNIPDDALPALLPQTQTLALGVWGAASGIFTIVMLAINYKTNLKAKGFDLREQGVIQSGKTIGKTVLLAVLAACCTIGIVFFAAYFFNTNFQFWAIMFRTFTADKVPYMLIALPMFPLFYIPNSIACHSFRFNKVGGKANVFIVALFNAASIIYIEIVQYSVFFATGQPFWHVESFDRQLGGWLLSTVVVMFVTPFIARKIYKETKNPYLGGILNAIVVVATVVSMTITYLPTV